MAIEVISASKVRGKPALEVTVEYGDGEEVTKVVPNTWTEEEILNYFRDRVRSTTAAVTTTSTRLRGLMYPEEDERYCPGGCGNVIDTDATECDNCDWTLSTVEARLE